MLYIMIKPPSAALRQVSARRAAYGIDDGYPADRLHCTMLRLGHEADWSTVRLWRFRGLLDTVSAEPFSLMFDLIAGNLLRSAKGIPAATAFHRLLRGKAEMCGASIDHSFWPHLTLAYSEAAIAPARKVDPVGWIVDEFLLVRSDRGHHLLDRWPLRARQYALAL